MIKKMICGLAFFLPMVVFSQQAKTVFVLGNQVKLTVPVEFEQIKDRNDTSDFIFEDRPFTVRFSVLTSDIEADDNNIPEYANRAIADVKSRRNPATIFDDGISLNNGKNISYIKYSFEKEPSPLFEYTFYGSLNEKLITFYFWCKLEDRPKWEKKIDAIVSSLRINDKEIN